MCVARARGAAVHLRSSRTGGWYVQTCARALHNNHSSSIMADATSAPAASPSLLTRDVVTLPGQNYALVSLVGPALSQRADRLAIKIRGCFATEEEARAHVKKLMDADPLFDVYVVNLYEWLLIPPDNTNIPDAHYQEEYLEGLLQGYHKNQTEARKLFEQRKLEVMRDGLDKHLAPDERHAPPPPPPPPPPPMLQAQQAQQQAQQQQE